MNYRIVQQVTLVDMNNELINEVFFDHGVFETFFLPIGSSVVTRPLGLKQFEVVHDRRTDDVVRFKIIDTEINLVTQGQEVRAFLEPITLIIGQHDVGEFYEE
ncbi:hypothetical protein EDM56_07600 [Brevibacillus fluminis]|uniref:Uncharacterized protein n=1 Tax=Brevibacillus fluminis TaxID=511487 RepID=A0A3M8DSA7_9BACL|nr:hypothetical protein [Brevibacillus fluminis]RNB90369.1 hypothetical protein EDM56_07600 [Brevibacillus fluminis]